MSVTTTTRHPPAMAFQPSSYAELAQFAQTAARSSMVPKDYAGKPENVMIAVQMGAELGLRPMQALQNISVINGRPSVWGDALLGLVRANPLCQDVIEKFEGEGDTLTAICIVKRAGSTPVEGRFSVADAKKAGLFSKPGPWVQYPKRMLQMRARGFGLRDAFPDVLRGLITAEEAQDIPPDNFSGPTITATAEPAPAHTPARTVRQFLDDLEQRFIDAASAEDVQAIIAGDDVQKALGALTNGGLARLQSLIATAEAQHQMRDPSTIDGDGVVQSDLEYLTAEAEKCETLAKLEQMQQAGAIRKMVIGLSPEDGAAYGITITALRERFGRQKGGGAS